MNKKLFLEMASELDEGDAVSKSIGDGLTIEVSLTVDPYPFIPGNYSNELGDGLTVDVSTGHVLTGECEFISDEILQGEFKGCNYYISNSSYLYDATINLATGNLFRDKGGVDYDEIAGFAPVVKYTEYDWELTVEGELADKELLELHKKVSSELSTWLDSHVQDPYDDDRWLETLGQLDGRHYRTRHQYKYFQLEGAATKEDADFDYGIARRCAQGEDVYYDLSVSLNVNGRSVGEGHMGSVFLAEDTDYIAELIGYLWNEIANPDNLMGIAKDVLTDALAAMEASKAIASMAGNARKGVN